MERVSNKKWNVWAQRIVCQALSHNFIKLLVRGDLTEEERRILQKVRKLAMDIEFLLEEINDEKI